MSIDIDAETEEGSKTLKINEFPDTCAICLERIDPRFLYSYFDDSEGEVKVLHQCPLCHSLFIAAYWYSNNADGEIYLLAKIIPEQARHNRFSSYITNLSRNFVSLFEESQYAEDLGLLGIIGPGYRKALEFLIKDYAINQNPDFSESIKSMFLAKVINDFVADGKIKSTAKRAAWLGNDETHYVREWDDKAIADLKRLINLTVQWIESEESTRRYEEEMKD